MNKNYKKLLKTLLLCSLALTQALVSSTLCAEPSESFKARIARFQNVGNEAEQEKSSAPLKIAGRPNAAAIFREKQAIAELEKALQSMDFQAIKRLIDSNQGLVNLQQVEPLRITVLKVCYNQNDRNKQLEILDYLLSVDGINVNLTSNKPITQNALDVAIKNINGLKSENLKAHYRIIAKKLIAQGAQLNELAQVEYAQEIVAQLSEVKPVVAEVQASVSSPIPQASIGSSGSGIEALPAQMPLQAGAGRISEIAQSGRPLRSADEPSSLGMRTQAAQSMTGLAGVAGRAELSSAQTGAAGRDGVSSEQAQSGQNAAHFSAQLGQSSDELIIPNKSAEISEGGIFLEERQRAEMSKKITRYTEELTQADDELRALRGKHSNQQDELNKIDEKIAKKERKIATLHQEREQLTNQLLEK